MTLNDRELATVLAAVRYWQNDLDDPLLTEGFNEHFSSVSRLDAGEIDRLCERLNSDTVGFADTIHLTWCVDDVLSLRKDLTRDQAREGLCLAERKHDANFGVCWDTLECWAEHLYPFREDADDRGIDDGVQTKSESPTYNDIPVLVDALEQSQTQLEQLASHHGRDGNFNKEAKCALESVLTNV